jgi:hypothetical protein
MVSKLELNYTSVDQRPFNTDYVWAEAVIGHPIETVWRHALDFPAWMFANHEWEPIAGETGKPGMLWRLWPRRHYVGDDCPAPHYHFVGIAKIIRHKLIAAEVWPEKGGSYGDRFVPPSYRGLDNILLTDLGGGRTDIRALFIATMDAQPGQQIDTSEEDEPAQNVMLHFENLQKVIAGTPLDAPATESFRDTDTASLSSTGSP